MTAGRKRRKAKQVRRDARRDKARRHEQAAAEPQDVPLVDEVQWALGEHPVELLDMVSTVVLATSPRPFAFEDEPVDDDENRPTELPDLVDAMIEVRCRETTALLAVLAEMLVDDEGLAAKCREELRTRDDDLPQWLSDLSQTTVRRAVRMSEAMGDGDEVILGVRLADGQDMTCAAFIDNNMMAMVRDAFFVPNPIEDVVAVAEQNLTEPDTTFVEMSLADARTWLSEGMVKGLLLSSEESDTWPGCRALLEWLIRGLPPGGSSRRGSGLDDQQTDELFESFFGSAAGAPFDSLEYRDLLRHCNDDGTGDPLRWSAIRVRQLLDGSLFVEDDVTVEGLYRMPDLLRAYIPFAHARSAIRDELTEEALAVIDDGEADYRELVAEEQEHRDEDDEDDELGSGG
jgi:hypothetical protein